MAEGRARNKRLAALAAGVGATAAAAAAAAAAAGGRPPTISERRAAELEAKLGGCSFLFSNDGADSYAVLTPPRFDLADEDAAAAAMSYLDEFGYLVVAAAAPPAALQRLRSLLWLELEALGRGIRRDDPATWHGFPTEPFAQSTVGLYVGCGLGQSEVMWTARALPGVRRPFELIWGTKELISSMDGLTMFRPVSHDPSWRTANGWWHCDQSGAKSGRHAVQGQLLLERQGPDAGGLCVLPKSHHRFEAAMRRAPDGLGAEDFVPIPPGDALLSDCPPALLCAEAGDMILWDSRVAHCSTSAFVDDGGGSGGGEGGGGDGCGGGGGSGTGETDTGLQRVTCQICMTPRRWASEAVLAQRVDAVANGSTGSHWPHGPGADEFRLADTPDPHWWNSRGNGSSSGGSGSRSERWRQITIDDMTAAQRSLV
jgi:hypothetical protein